MRGASSNRSVNWAVAAAAVLAVGAAGVVARAADEPATRPASPKADQTTVRGVVTVNPVERAGGGFAGGGYIRLTPMGDPDKAAYLGLLTSPAQPALQKQLRLKAGVGLVVDGVEPDSPAAQAGVREFDVLHKLDDQLLINTEQFEVLIRASSPGSEINLTVIREGKPQTLKAKLAERELGPLTLVAPGHLEFDRAGLTPVPGADQNPFVAYFETTPSNNFRRGVNVRQPGAKDVVRAARITIESEEHKLTVTNPDGRRHLKIEDKAGKPLFEGPIETREELEKVPDDLRQAYEDLLIDPLAEPAPQPPPSEPQPHPTKPPTDGE